MSGEGSREVRYTAFLSYSHKDAAAAGRLHRRLEAYRMPRRLAGTEGARGPVPDRLWPIFRDREELPAATDLSETVRAALAQSGALIILCSPAAAVSLWVAEEIETFRRLHPHRPILAAVLDGDPPDCFPAALRAFGRDGTWHEPLATDLRAHRDGARLGLLKLVAGITGVGLDALVQRDAARRVRRVMAVTLGAVAMMLVMAALAVVAVRARAEAERQRAGAEGLAGYMLTDLRQKLRGVGRLGIMRAVNLRALDYYDLRIAHGDRSAHTLIQRARVLQAMGEDDLAGGDYRTALALFSQAYQTTAEQLASAPSDAERIFAHAQSEYWMGQFYREHESLAVAQPYYTRYAAAAERLIAISPGNPDYMIEMAFGAHNMGIVQFEAGDSVGAQTLFESALRWFARAARLRPGDENIRREQANTYAFLADSFYMRRLWRASLAARLSEYQLKVRLYRSDPSNDERAYRLASAQRAVARLYDRVGDRAHSRAFLLSAYDSARQLTARDSGNVTWLLLRTKVECDLLNQTSARDRDIPDNRLRTSILLVRDALTAQHNPRLSEISHCLASLGPS